jgi:hypothetical protein
MTKIDIVKNIHAMGVRKAKISSVVEGYHLKNIRKAEQATNRRIAQHDVRQSELEQIFSDQFSKFERKERLELQKGKVLGQDAPNSANLTPERKALIKEIKEEKAGKEWWGKFLAKDIVQKRKVRKPKSIQEPIVRESKQQSGQNLDITSKSDNSTTKTDETKSGWTTTQKALAWAGGGLAALGGGAAIFSKNPKDKQIQETVNQAA